jgi:hypothetical protein
LITKPEITLQQNPKAPEINKPAKYHFQIFALDTMLNLPERA